VKGSNRKTKTRAESKHKDSESDRTISEKPVKRAKSKPRTERPKTQVLRKRHRTMLTL
jgi:hypothetical protein